MENAIGYVQNLSPTKKGTKRKISYFDFMLQTGEQQHSRAVCFQQSLRTNFESYQTSGIPVKIRNISRRPNLDDASTKDHHNRSVVEKASPSELNFEGQSLAENAEAPEFLIEDIQSVEVGQKLTVKGMLMIMDIDNVRIIEVNGVSRRVFDTCTITDNTGSIRITLWEQNIRDLMDGVSYKFTGVRVKEFNGKKLLTTTPTTVFEIIEEQFPVPEFDVLNTRRTITVQGIGMLKNFSTWYSCKNCRKLTEVSTIPKVKCRCGAILLAQSCPKSSSVCIAISDPDVESDTSVWLTVFTDEINIMLGHVDNDLSLMSPEDEITSALLGLTGITIEYDTE